MAISTEITCPLHLSPLKGELQDKVVHPHDNIHEINTWKCPIQPQCGYIGYIPMITSMKSTHESVPFKHSVVI